MIVLSQELVLSEKHLGLGDPTPSIENETDSIQYFQRPPCVERWLRNKARSTRKKFLGYMSRFQLLTGLSPEQFLGWVKTVESVEVQDLIDRTSMEFKPAIQFCYRWRFGAFYGTMATIACRRLTSNTYHRHGTEVTSVSRSKLSSVI